MSSANVYFVDFEKVNIYFRKFDVWSEAHYDYVRGMVTNSIKYLFKQVWFFVFQIKIKNKKQTSNLNSNVQLFWKSENHLFWCFLSQLQYRNYYQNFISNFIFQFIKNTDSKHQSSCGTKFSLFKCCKKFKNIVKQTPSRRDSKSSLKICNKRWQAQSTKCYCNL